MSCVGVLNSSHISSRWIEVEQQSIVIAYPNFSPVSTLLHIPLEVVAVG